MGSTEYIIRALDAAPEPRFVLGDRDGAEPRSQAQARRAPETRQVTFLDRTVCYCSTMNRIDLPHLVWALENLADGQRGQPHRRGRADPERWARVALDRMLALPGETAKD